MKTNRFEKKLGLFLGTLIVLLYLCAFLYGLYSEKILTSGSYGRYYPEYSDY